MKHLHADLIKAYAEDSSVMFVCPQLGIGRYSIVMVLTNSNYDWTIYKPEKWAKEKEAYARGEKIECCRNADGDIWLEVSDPGWYEGIDYRIAKPKTETRWLFYDKDGFVRLLPTPTKFYPFKIEGSDTQVEVTE